jgi:hypothetical protein
MRMYETFYGIHTDDWTVDFGTFSNHHKILVKEYISDGASCTTSSSATNTHKFIFPHHIKKTYFIEGEISGQVTFAASSATSYLCAYRVSVCKMNEDTTDTELFTTGWKSVNKTLYWNSTYKVGDEIVLPFWIDAWNEAKLDEKDRIYVKVESTCTDSAAFASCAASSCTNIALLHGNDATWEDLKIEIPFLGV